MQVVKRTFVIGLVAAALLAATQLAWAGPTTDPPTAAGYGAGWLAGQFNASGFLADSKGNADLGDTTTAALALAAANVGATQFNAADTYLQAHADAVIKDSSGNDQPGRLGELLLLAKAHGDSPHSFGGIDLVARLQATRQTTGTDTGFFGASAGGAASFDGAVRQSLGLLGLAAAGVAPDATSVTWLTNQQCPDGGWEAYRADTTKACDPTDLTNFVGEDTNSTAFAEQALVALKAAPAHDPLAFLDGAQNTDGGFGFFKGSSTDANSTGLGLQAIVAGGENPTAGRWATGAANPDAALLALQLGCEAAAGDRGSFAFQPGTADATSRLLATIQAVPGAAGTPFPLAQATPATALPAVPCSTPTTSTTVAVTPTTAPGASATATPTTVAPSTVGGTTLPATGPATTHGLVRLALVLIGFGVALVTVGRRRRQGWVHSIRRGA